MEPTPNASIEPNHVQSDRLLLDVHHDVQHFDFGSVSFLGMGLQKSK